MLNLFLRRKINNIPLSNPIKHKVLTNLARAHRQYNRQQRSDVQKLFRICSEPFVIIVGS